MNEVTQTFAGEAIHTLPENGQGRLILVDCNGTLLEPFNPLLFRFLQEAEKRNYGVVLHSTKPADVEEYTLVPLMCRNKEFRAFMAGKEPAVTEKNVEFHSRDAFVTFDDEHGGGYISYAPNQWGPNDPRIAATLAAWGVVLDTKTAPLVPGQQPQPIPAPAA